MLLEEDLIQNNIFTEFIQQVCKYYREEMTESGGLLRSGELRSYGALRNQGQSIMLTKFDTKSFTHTLEPTDTLQGVAIKYGVTVERLKRINKLWSNDAFLIRDTLQIPDDEETTSEPTGSLNSFRLDSDSEDDSEEVVKATIATKKTASTNSSKEDLDSSCKENEEHLANNGISSSSSGDSELDKSETVKCFDSIFSKIDGQIKEYKDSVRSQVGSEGYNDFNAMLSKIDGQIHDHKSRNPPSSEATDLGYIAYDGGYQNVRFYNSYTPPNKRQPLEQGI